ncbi:SWIM zinc finger family protein [Yinghuangia sp. YIM S10712]|uniref:SWIM zinc finger family protein n=1 Tax=Yinghuangia sp. YIM S10712 TaxID=3436930 RepID=UPI003F53C7A7
MDNGRLQRGRTYARRGDVDAITVTPGRVEARVHGSRRTPYRTHVALPQLTDTEWNRFLDTVAAQAGHIAALLDRDMPTELVEDAEAARVRLLPGPSDLEPSCSCPDWGYPCKHGAALCYQVARLLDEDPFVLLLIRGRGESELLDELQRRNAAHAAVEHSPTSPATSHIAPTGRTARSVFEAYRLGLPPVPELPPMPERAGRPPTLVGIEAPGPAIIPAGLEILASDAAMRARQLLAHAIDDAHPDSAPTPELTEWQDAVRMCAVHPDVELFARVAAGTGRSAETLAQAVRAWRHGGATGLTVLEEPWDPPQSEMERARAQLKDDWPAEAPLPRLRTWRNRWTVERHNAQLRLGRDHLWYPYRKTNGAWWPYSAPEPQAAVALGLVLDIDA